MHLYKVWPVLHGLIKLIGNTPSPEQEITCKTPRYNLTNFSNTLGSVIWREIDLKRPCNQPWPTYRSTLLSGGIRQVCYTAFMKYFAKTVSYIKLHLSKLYSMAPNVQPKTTADSFCACCQRVFGIAYRNTSQPLVKMVVMVNHKRLYSLSKICRQP